MNRDIYKKIEKYLYKYKNIDTSIKDIKNSIAEHLQLGYSNWIKSKTNNGITLEDKIIEMENNRTIVKLEAWKELISEILEKYKKFDVIKYQYICLKYFDNANIEEITEKLQVNKKEQKDMQDIIIKHIFSCAIRKKLLKRE